MRDPVDQYLDEVLSYASLAAGDRRRIHAELKDHLEELAAPARLNHLSGQEILTMLHDEFGKPQSIGAAIAAAKGKFRTYLKKKLRRLAVAIPVVLLFAFSVRYAVAEVFYAPTDAAAPSVPQGSRVLVYKLAREFHPDDVIVYRAADGTFRIGIVRSVSADNNTLIVAKNHEPNRPVARADVVGRVFLNTR